MTGLPASVEAYLKETGFSSTEILVLHHLLTGEAMTLRELAGKTGKSTGVLDQAMKKLLRRSIVQRQSVNGIPKHTIGSLEDVLAWVRRDTEQKQSTIARRAQDFTSFIASFQRDKERPGIEYFEGAAGVQDAYRKLLASAEGMMLHYLPVSSKEEDDPLREFRVQYFRERRKRGVFSRVLAPDTHLGRRYQSRDCFEYRETVLLSQEEFPSSFEKVIAGNVIGCFNHGEGRACLIHYPELAEAERGIFQTLWSNAKEWRLSHGDEAHRTAVQPAPIATRTLSSLREFLLSRRSLLTFGIFGVLAGVLTYALYTQNVSANFQRIRENTVAIATTGALQFAATDIEALHGENDYRKPEWSRVVGLLENIRTNNADIFFAYIFRRDPDDPGKLEFVADSHSLNPYANTDDDPTNDVDVDRNGVLDDIDVLQWPGQPYPIPHDEIFQAFEKPMATSDFYEDSWGKYVTGYAPIRDASGETVAVLAVDVAPTKLYELNRETFKSLLYFVAFFLLFMVIRFAAFNRSLCREIFGILRSKRVLESLKFLWF